MAYYSHPTDEEMVSSLIEDGVDDKMIMLGLAVFSIILLLKILIHHYAKFVLRQPEENRSAIGALALRFALLSSEAEEPEPEPEQPNVGLDPSQIVALPLYVYCVREAGQGHENEPDIECSICLSMFNAGDRVRILPNCEHSFHAECIDKWLGLNATCSICRACVTPMLQFEPRWLGPVDIVLTTTASSLCRRGTSDHEPPSQSRSRQHCTSSPRRVLV